MSLMIGRASRREHILILITCLFFASCSRSKDVSPEELRSDLASGVSLASETELFVSQLLQNRIAPAFAGAHLNYLRREAKRASDALQEARASEGMSSQLASCRAQMAELASLLANLENNTGDRNQLSHASEEARRIRKILEHANAEI
jgi:hypothetical protein